MRPLYTVEQVRAAEAPLLAAQQRPDELMRKAAHQVARAAQDMLDSKYGRILVLAGSGGNGGDALYAATELKAASLEAVLMGGRVHQPALAAFEAAGGTVVEKPLGEYALVIDGITGIGGTGALRDWAAGIVASIDAPVLSVDIPSGVDADTGATHGAHVKARRTITFSGLRYAHAFASACGEVTVADIGLEFEPADAFLWNALTDNLPLKLEPGESDDKYTGGVVGICAGSTQYPGAGIMCSIAAVRATPSMVRYIGDICPLPEIVPHPSIAEAARVQAWVYGPGRGERDELAELLARPEALLIDASGLTVLARDAALREQLIERKFPTVLTPHVGEFVQLVEGFRLPVNLEDWVGSARALAVHTGTTVLLKGRRTVITDGVNPTNIVDLGTSWAATPGSGDVLSGLAGAWLATPLLDKWGAVKVMTLAALIHGQAAEIAARTEYGHAPTSASLIIDAIRPATARVCGPAG
ncbi:bifunctional ADP-dependent NAD(P)H-hydrate dehydratase/NAD(P)H-hydrate epimerase [Corynebacterium canis]|uniref:Bifunctional NAD(P)H-hydrate repair enzyme n=1 Tax=Corynebacterium canis TaxID=679663 RepID=A0A5C5UB59_9CORY|nr:bifunctional ADP-dependent NAD(P)H-hydrate dehydratase/NAD(P)H-hydrate epimerase [Corynebacterium canis]TWT22775.1 bifunctional ADP-dependent NAD(P)H-hydrate dehydratase/NAD(P)H-hydrate epimerase [Corynebacterium canis]WJY74299.1 Bifunctional NAD(P)H-hydrate repair enzyme Nnr [Corynebacterium canis]